MGIIHIVIYSPFLVVGRSPSSVWDHAIN